jgi:cytochrome d ubiquinol oxidase subunit II
MQYYADLATMLLISLTAVVGVFALTGLTIALATVTVFAGLFPRVMVSSLNPQWSMTIYSASSSPYTLQVMTVVAVVFVPIVLIYQGWSYWVFRERLSSARQLEY